jgi:cytidylate kinase
MPLVAMTREMGSLGMDVARILESELKVPLVYHEMINNLADKMRLRKSHVIRLLGGKANLLERLTADKTSLSIFTADEMLQVASKGAVMRGWGAAHLLRPVSHAICVRVCAPFDVRVKRMMSRLDTDDRDTVASEIRDSDEAQGAIVKRHFGVDCRDPEGYDLSLNTERMSVERCAEEIMRVATQPEFRETDESRRALGDLALQANVRAALRADPQTRGSPSRSTPTARAYACAASSRPAGSRPAQRASSWRCRASWRSRTNFASPRTSARPWASEGSGREEKSNRPGLPGKAGSHFTGGIQDVSHPTQHIEKSRSGPGRGRRLAVRPRRRCQNHKDLASVPRRIDRHR